MNMLKSVTITEADNGYIVSCYGNEGEKKIVAKNFKDAFIALKKLFKVKDSDRKLAEDVVGRMNY